MTHKYNQLPFVNDPHIIVLQQAIVDLNERIVKLENRLTVEDREKELFHKVSPLLGLSLP